MKDGSNQYDIGDDRKSKQPWFGPKRFGYGYGPRTWQGVAVTAVLVAFAILVATVTKGHMPGILIGIIPAIVVPLLIMAIQRR
jgi:hypothetical protein